MENLLPTFSDLFRDYFSFYSVIQPPLIKEIATDNIAKTYYELRPDLINTNTDYTESDEFGGRLSLPKKVGDIIHILLNKSKINNEDWTWICTFAHETTHALDFHLMAQKEQLKSYDPLLKKDKYFMFQMWSEYHSQKLGYNFLQHWLKSDMYPANIRINFILNTEMPYWIDNSYSDYHKTTDAGSQIYGLMQFLGRFSVWIDLFPEVFNTVFLKDLFKKSMWMYDILIFLRQNSSLSDIYSNFEEMKNVFRKHWGTL